jgi:arsenite methyltransferase
VALPLPDHCLDAAITVNTLYFVADLDTACTELARVLRPGGRLVVGIGGPEAMARMPFTAYGFTLRSVDDVIAVLRKAGFDLTDHQHLAGRHSDPAPPAGRHSLGRRPFVTNRE